MTIKRKDAKIMLTAIVSFYAVMSITYLSQIFHISGSITLILRLGIISITNLAMLLKRRKFSSVYKLLWVWWGLIFVSSIIHKCDLLYFLTLQSRVVAVCSLLEYYSKNPRQLKVFLYTWKNICLVLCVLDVATIVMFPNGLYAGELYADVWLLGYKTARLVYNLPLAILTCYLSYMDKNEISFEVILTLFCCLISSFMVGATGATVALVFYLLMISYSIFRRRSATLRKILSRVLSFRIIVIVYSILVIMVVTGSAFVVRFAHNSLGKSETLSHRTVIWERCIQIFFENPLIGNGYLTTDQYINNITLLRLGTSAHNMVLSILLTVGILGLVVYTFILYSAISQCGKNYSICNLILIIGVITYFVVGLSSSSLIFSAFAFLPHLLMNYQMEQQQV